MMSGQEKNERDRPRPPCEIYYRIAKITVILKELH